MKQEAEIAPPYLDRHRYQAIVSLLGRLRHELASPLSGASLHLEIARRRLSAAACESALESVGHAQREVAYTSALLEAMSAPARTADAESVELSLADVVAGGAARVRSDAATRGISVLTPEGGGDRLVGFREMLEQAVEALTAEAVARSREGGAVVWELERRSGAELGAFRLACRFTGPLPAVSLDRIFGASRGGAGADSSLLLARCFVECHGGALDVESDASGVSFVITFPNETGAPGFPRQGGE